MTSKRSDIRQTSSSVILSEAKDLASPAIDTRSFASLRMTRTHLCSEFRSLRIVQRIARDRRAEARSKILYLHMRSFPREIDRKISVRDAAIDREAVGRAGDVADDAIVRPDRLFAHHHVRRI